MATPATISVQLPDPLNPEYSQPSTYIALTTTFTPPASCDRDLLTQLPPAAGYLIWNNEPYPVANQTSTQCYPPEFISAYRSVSFGTLGSSIVPAMSPLVCPANYCTVFANGAKYMACCPSGYGFHPPSSIQDIARPAYGGTCYRELKFGSTYPLQRIDSNAVTTLTEWAPNSAGDQAFAHPIDGFATAWSPSVGCPGGVSVSESSSSAVAPSSSTSHSTKLSGGAIAGIVIGAIVGLVTVVALIWFLLQRHKRKAAAKSTRAEEAMVQNSLWNSAGRSELYNDGIAELDGKSAAECPAGDTKQELDARTHPAEAEAEAKFNNPKR